MHAKTNSSTWTAALGSVAATALLVLVGCRSMEAAPAQEGGKDQDSKIAKLNHKREVAEIALRIAELESTGEEKAAAAEVAKAERSVASARKKLEHFEGEGKALTLSEGVLRLDRARYRAQEAEEELQELEAMYKLEEFAETTKELVLMRGRKQLEFAKRELDHSQRELAQLEDQKFVEQHEELTEEIIAAEVAVNSAQNKLEVAKLEGEKSLKEARFELEQAMRELEKKPGEGDEDSKGEEEGKDNGDQAGKSEENQ